MISINSNQIEIIKKNLSNLEEVCIKYPLLESYRKDEISISKISGLGLNEWINFIDFIKVINNIGLKPYYEEPISYKHLRKELVSLSVGSKACNIFSKKNEEDFLLTITDYKVNKRYTNNCNLSYFVGLFKGDVLILNYLIQKLNNQDLKKIGTSDIYTIDGKRTINVIDRSFNNIRFYNHEIKLPTFRNLEFDMVGKFISTLDNTLGEFDFRKCNVSLLRNEINTFISNKFKIENGTRVKALNNLYNPKGELVIEKDKFYSVDMSTIDNNGFLTIKVDGMSINFPYSNFEDVSRMRDDLLNELFGDSGS